MNNLLVGKGTAVLVVGGLSPSKVGSRSWALGSAAMAAGSGAGAAGMPESGEVMELATVGSESSVDFTTPVTGTLVSEKN